MSATAAEISRGLVVALVKQPIRMTGKTASLQGFCLQSYLDGLITEAFVALTANPIAAGAT